MDSARQGFGITNLDALLGGGLRPGTLTVVAGATGVGKTQLGLQWAHAGLAAEGRRGVICDLTSRGDSQHHHGYATRLASWDLRRFPHEGPVDLDAIWDLDAHPGESLQPFLRQGRRVTRQDLEPDDWHAWKGELARVLRVAAAFGYTHFVRGCRRVVVDGIEPADRSADSVQVEFFEYLYHHVIHKEDAWAARELLRERFRALEHQVLRHPYDHQAIGCLMLYTTPKVMLDELIREPLVQGDVFANANTVILMGRTAQGSHMGRALHIAKHRGSACDDGIHPYRITDSGLVFDPG